MGHTRTTHTYTEHSSTLTVSLPVDIYRGVLSFPASRTLAVAIPTYTKHTNTHIQLSGGIFIAPRDCLPRLVACVFVRLRVAVGSPSLTNGPVNHTW